MRARVLLLAGLAGCAALAACNGSSDDQPANREGEAVQAEQVRDVAGWDRVFHAPDQALEGARALGFKGLDYAPTGSEPPYQAKSEPLTLSSAAADSSNQASFTAEGNSGDSIDTVVFSLTLSDSENAQAAEQRFTELVGTYLAKFGLRDDNGILAAIAKEQNADGTVADAPVTIDTGVQTGAMPEVINVTFTRPAASAADNSKPQG